MASTVPLILKAEPVPRVDIGPRRSRTPSVAVVYATGDGDVEVLDGGKPMRWSDQMFSRYRMRYEVDLSDHRRTVELRSTPLPARGDFYHFDATLNVGFRVTSPDEVVRRQITDGLAVVYGHLVDVCWSISRNFAVEDARGAEDAINARFRLGETLNEGITLFMCRARLLPDAAARQYLTDQEEARRANLVHAARHELNTDDAARVNQLGLIRQSGELTRRDRERDALADRPLDIGELMRIHLERNPQNSHEALVLMANLEQARANRLDEQDDRWRGLFQFMVEHDLVQPVDIERFRDQAMRQLQGAAAQPAALSGPVGWDEPLPGLSATAAAPQPTGGHAQPAGTPSALPGLIPVYVVIDESTAVGGCVEHLNAGVRSLYDALAAAPEIASVVRLSVFGYADDVAVQLALATVGVGTRLPHLSGRGSARYAKAFERLLDCIPRDAATLKAQNPSVRRPQVLFLSGGQPIDGQSWSTPYQALTDRQQQRFAPDIVACGVGDAAPATIASIATRPELAFVALEQDMGTAIDRFCAFARHHVLQYGRAVLDGDQGPILTGPEGFRLAKELI